VLVIRETVRHLGATCQAEAPVALGADDRRSGWSWVLRTGDAQPDEERQSEYGEDLDGVKNGAHGRQSRRCVTTRASPCSTSDSS
jgi:hypothetical protein